MLSKSILVAVLGGAIASMAQPIEPRDEPSTITCEDKGKPSWLYFGDQYYSGQGGLVGFTGDRLSIDGIFGDISPFAVQSARCNSTYLDLTIPQDPSGKDFGKPNPLKFFITGGQYDGKCLGLSSTTQVNATIGAVDCSDLEDESQSNQFWLRDYKYGSIIPAGDQHNRPQDRWELFQWDGSGSGVIVSNPSSCFDGQFCQSDHPISFHQGGTV